MTINTVMLPTGWVLAKLEDLVINPKRDIVDGPFGSDLKASEYVDFGVPIIRLQNIERNCFVEKNIKFITPDKAAKLLRHSFQQGDIVITKLGSPLGKACVIPSTIKPGVIIADVVRARIDEQKISNVYVVFAINAPEVIAQLNTEVKGTTRPRVNLNHIRSLIIPLPPFKEQHRIVAKLEVLLGKIDACRERLEKIPLMLKQFRQMVLAEACDGRLTADWRENNLNIAPAKELLQEINLYLFKKAKTNKEKEKIQNPCYDQDKNFLLDITNIPLSWTYCHIGAIGLVINGSTPSRKLSKYWQGNIPWVSSGEVCNNRIHHTKENISEEGYSNSSVKLLPIGTVLLAMIGEGKTRGQAAILKISATVNQNIAAIIIDHGLVIPEYLWFWFQYTYEITREIGSGSGPQALNCQRVRELPFILPPFPEQQEIVRQVELLFQLADQLEARYQKAKTYISQFTQVILAKAFRGELVPQDPNDEPASVLLDRIRAMPCEKPPEKTKIERKPMTSKLTPDVLKGTIRSLPKNQFQFDDLRKEVSTDYETLKEVLFKLLSESPPSIKQVFDLETKTMLLERVNL